MGGASRSEAGCAIDAAPASGPKYAYDLDGDGTPETNLSVGSCPAFDVDPPLDPVVGRHPQRRHARERHEPLPWLYGQPIHDIGSYVGTSLHEVSAVSCPAGVPQLDVVDVAAGASVATNIAPASLATYYAYTDAPLRADGRREPFLASSLELSPYPWATHACFATARRTRGAAATTSSAS